MKFSNIKKVYKMDWKKIAKNPVAIIILIGICVIPSLYAWVNIQACWDIYENTDMIPVAIVNNDKDVYFKGEKINVGSKIVSQLKKNNQIKWVFTNSNDANLGLIDSTYYAIIEIPSDFSSKFLTILTDNPQKPQIIYKENTKANAVASKITATANSTLVEQISTEFISSVNEIVFSSFNDVGDNALKNKQKIIKVKDSVIDINKNMNIITNSLQNISTSSDNLSNFLESISNTMPSVQSGLESVDKSNANNQKILNSMQKSVHNSVENVNLNLNFIKISNTKIKNLFNNLNESTSNSSNINTVLPVISTQLNSMNSSIDATIDYLKKCNSYDNSSDIDGAITSLTKLKTELTDIKKSLVNFQTQLKTLSGSVDELYDYLEKEIPQLEDDLKSMDQNLSNTIIQLEELNKAFQNEYLTHAINALKIIQSSNLSNKLIETLENIKNSKVITQAMLKSLDNTIATSIQQINSADEKINTAVNFLKSSKSSNITKKQQVSNMIMYLQNIKKYITDEQNQLSNIRNQLNSANHISKNTLNVVNNDTNKISSQMNDAIRIYNSSVENHLENILNNLIISLQDSSELIKNAQNLSGQISSMVKTAQKGSKLTSEFTNRLNKKLLQFKDVISLLGNKFEQVSNDDIVQIISILQNDPKLMGNYISNPFEIKQESINEIPNYGSGMTPLYTALAIWVGCIILCSILKTKTAHANEIEQLTLQENHFGKMLLFSTLAVIQGLIIALGNIFILKIYVVNPALFIFFCVLSSLVYCIITFTLVSTLGNIGKALSVIYLILQVAGSGGSYPIQVEPMIFRILQPLFPFTYTLSGLREAIAGPLISRVIWDVVALVIFAVVFLVGGYFTVKPFNDKIYKFEQNFKKSGLGE